MKASKLFTEFFESEKAGGIILIICTILSLFLANSDISNSYIHFWQTTIAGHSFSHWINDGLMTIFFLLIGLELEREIYIGELSKIKNALLPFSAAIGGMIVPAFIYLLFTFGTKTQSGIGIPMATDIAFAIGILSLLGNKVPVSLKIFLTALAVIDDLGAILIIALFYTKTIIWTNILVVFGILVLLYILNRLKVKNLIPYLIGGFFMWYFMLNSGIHATITGILLAFVIPFGNGDKKSTSYILQHILHKPVAFVILPLFAMANTAIIINSGWQNSLTERYSLAIAIGLIIGKPLGISLFSYLAVQLNITKLPTDLNWKSIIAVSFLGGIGFTMSIFITLIAFENEDYITNSKIIILLASLISGIIGFVALTWVYNKKQLKN